MKRKRREIVMKRIIVKTDEIESVKYGCEIPVLFRINLPDVPPLWMSVFFLSSEIKNKGSACISGEENTCYFEIPQKRAQEIEIEFSDWAKKEYKDNKICMWFV